MSKKGESPSTASSPPPFPVVAHNLKVFDPLNKIRSHQLQFLKKDGDTTDFD